jgi:Domain of unknown function (DUF4214)
VILAQGRCVAESSWDHMEQSARSSGSLLGTMPTDKFGSLSLSRAYIDTLQDGIGSLEGGQLISALERLDDAYDEFPELELDRPRGQLLEGLRAAAENMPDRSAIPLLMYCVSASPCCSSSLGSLVEKIITADYWPSLSEVLRSLCCRKFCWRAIEPIINLLRQQGRTETVLQLISEVLGRIEFTKEESAFELGDVLKRLLSDQRRLGIGNAMLAQAVQSARRRLSRPSLGRNGQASREVLLAMAERLRPTPCPARLSPYPDLGWPSCRMSFDEFLLQWPCEVELPVELEDTAFIEEAYRAILLREPDIAERNQYLRLLHDGVASKPWIIEDLLASEELRSLERQVRVICGGQVITERGSSGEEETPAVTWPWRSPGDD